MCCRNEMGMCNAVVTIIQYGVGSRFVGGIVVYWLLVVVSSSMFTSASILLSCRPSIIAVEEDSKCSFLVLVLAHVALPVLRSSALGTRTPGSLALRSFHTAVLSLVLKLPSKLVAAARFAEGNTLMPELGEAACYC